MKSYAILFMLTAMATLAYSAEYYIKIVNQTVVWGSAGSEINCVGTVFESNGELFMVITTRFLDNQELNSNLTLDLLTIQGLCNLAIAGTNVVMYARMMTPNNDTIVWNGMQVTVVNQIDVQFNSGTSFSTESAIKFKFKFVKVDVELAFVTLSSVPLVEEKTTRILIQDGDVQEVACKTFSAKEKFSVVGKNYYPLMYVQEPLLYYTTKSSLNSIYKEKGTKGFIEAGPDTVAKKERIAIFDIAMNEMDTEIVFNYFCRPIEVIVLVVYYLQGKQKQNRKYFLVNASMDESNRQIIIPDAKFFDLNVHGNEKLQGEAPAYASNWEVIFNPTDSIRLQREFDVFLRYGRIENSNSYVHSWENWQAVETPKKTLEKIIQYENLIFRNPPQKHL